METKVVESRVKKGEGMMADFVKVASSNEISPGECKVALVADKAIALYNVDGKFYATDNTCLHRGGPLGEGSLKGAIVTCPLHGWQYDVTNGSNAMNPSISVATYAVKVDGDSIMVKL